MLVKKIKHFQLITFSNSLTFSSASSNTSDVFLDKFIRTKPSALETMYSSSEIKKKQ